MQSVIGGLCVAYWAVLTMVLLVPDPEHAFRIRGAWHKFVAPLMPYSHLISFFILAVLALAVRWPVPRWSVVVALVTYGALTEILQRYAPPRTPELADWFQDIGGVLLAVTICWAGATALRGRWRADVRQASGAGDDSKNWKSIGGWRRGALSWWR